MNCKVVLTLILKAQCKNPLDWAVVIPLPKWSHYRGGPITEVVPLQRWSHYRGGPITEVVSLQRWSHYRGGSITEVVPLQRWSLSRLPMISISVHDRTLSLIEIHPWYLHCVIYLMIVCLPLYSTKVEAFHLNFLLKLMDVKDNINKQPLLHHLVAMVMEKFPNSTDMHAELGSVHRVAKVSGCLQCNPQPPNTVHTLV